jgi:hypothetical protein
MGGNMSIYLKEKDIDNFVEFVSEDVGNFFFGYGNFETTNAEVEEDERDENDESLINSISINFAFQQNNYDEDGWISVSRGCIRTYFDEDFERFYKEER